MEVAYQETGNGQHVQLGQLNLSDWTGTKNLSVNTTQNEKTFTRGLPG
jgi:hypothetical protein